jgi:hypothetical protein
MVQMEKSIFIRRKYHRFLNTCFLFETFLYTEFFSKVSENDDTNHLYIEALNLSNDLIDEKFIKNVFNEIWHFSEQIDINPVLSEDLIQDILTTSNDNDDFFKLTREFDLFDFDYKILEQIKEYSINIIKEYDGLIKMRHFFKNYNLFVKNEIVSKYKVELLIAEDNICMN